MKHRAAITRIQVEQSEGGKTVIGSRGTGVLITEQLILTALHVVANRSVKPPVFHPGTITLKFPWGTTTATPVTNALNPDLDWVLLECAQPIDAHQAQPIPFGDVTADEKDIAWETFGFPDANPEGMRLVGQVRMLETEWQGQPVLQLYSDEAAAGDGSPVAGLSGAPCIVEDALVGVLRSSLLTKEKRNVAGTLFASPLSRILEDIAHKCPELRLPMADPCRGLPGLPRRDLPGAPYRLLARYEQTDAEVFFGRNNAIRDLYEKLTDTDAPRIVLLYGQSGAGKSSLLEAGLFSRLREVQAIEYRRRSAQRSLADELRDAIQNDWLARETKEEKPLLVVPGSSRRSLYGATEIPDHEIIELLRVVKDIFGASSPPRGRLLLSLRKEWLPEVRARIEEMRLSASMMFLERLDRQGIIGVVHGLASTRRLQRRYGANVEANLGIMIADDLLEDHGSPIAPTLQIIMSKLWAKAVEQAPDAPVLQVTAYQELKSKGILLADYLRAEIASLPQDLRPYVENGLVDDILEAHTTFLGTGASMDAEVLRARYAHIAPEVLARLQNALEKGYLLTRPASRELRQESATRLGHDTLAPLVRERYRRSDKPGQRARRLLEVRSGAWEQNQSGMPLDSDDLEQVENGLAGMRVPTRTELRLLEASRNARRTGLIVNASVIALVLAMATLLVFMWMGSIKSEAKAEQDANRIRREQAARHFEFSHDKTDLRQALVHMSRAIEIAPDDDPRLDLYIARALHLFTQLPTASVRVTEEWVSQAAVGGNGSRVLVVDRSSEEVRTYTVRMGELRDGLEMSEGVRLVDEQGNAFKYGLQGPPMLISDDGQWTLGYRSSGIEIWDASTGKSVHHIETPTGYVLKGAKWDPLSKNVFAFLDVRSRGSRVWLAASFDGTWQSVPLVEDEPDKRFIDLTLGFEAAGRALVVSIEMAKGEESKAKGGKIEPNQLRVIDARSRKPIYSEEAGVSLPSGLHDVALDPSGQRLVLLYDGDKPDPTDDRIDVWDVMSGRLLATIPVDTGGRFKSMTNPKLLTVDDNALKIVFGRRDHGDPTMVRPFEPLEHIRVHAFELICENQAQSFLSNHAVGCQVKQSTHGFGFQVMSMDSTLPVDQGFSEDSSWLSRGSKGDRIFTVDPNGWFNLHALAPRAVVRALPIQSADRLLLAKFTADGRYLLGVTSHGRAELFSTKDATSLWHDDWYDGVLPDDLPMFADISKDGRYIVLVVRRNDAKKSLLDVRVWDTRDKKVDTTTLEEEPDVTRPGDINLDEDGVVTRNAPVSFVGDNPTIVVSVGTYSIKTWTPWSSKPVIAGAVQGGAIVGSLGFCADGKKLLEDTRSGYRFVEVPTGVPIDIAPFGFDRGGTELDITRMLLDSRAIVVKQKTPRSNAAIIAGYDGSNSQVYWDLAPGQTTVWSTLKDDKGNQRTETLRKTNYDGATLETIIFDPFHFRSAFRPQHSMTIFVQSLGTGTRINTGFVHPAHGKLLAMSFIERGEKLVTIMDDGTLREWFVGHHYDKKPDWAKDLGALVAGASIADAPDNETQIQPEPDMLYGAARNAAIQPIVNAAAEGDPGAVHVLGHLTGKGVAQPEAH